MDLKKFVKQVIVDLDSAVSEANATTKRDIRFRGVKEQRTALEFDIAVTVESKNSTDAEGAIKVLGIIEGGLAGASEKTNSVVSRVSFGLDIAEFTRQEQQEHQSRISQAMEKQSQNSWQNSAL